MFMELERRCFLRFLFAVAAATTTVLYRSAYFWRYQKPALFYKINRVPGKEFVSRVYD